MYNNVYYPIESNHSINDTCSLTIQYSYKYDKYLTISPDLPYK